MRNLDVVCQVGGGGVVYFRKGAVLACNQYVAKFRNKFVFQSLLLKHILKILVVTRGVANDAQFVVAVHDVVYCAQSVGFLVVHLALFAVAQLLAEFRKGVRNVTCPRDAYAKHRFSRPVFVEHILYFVYVAQHAFCLLYQQFAVGGQHNALCRTIKNNNSQFLFKVFYRAAEVRLRHVKRFACLAYRAVFGNFHGIFKVLNIHNYLFI